MNKLFLSLLLICHNLFGAVTYFGTNVDEPGYTDIGGYTVGNLTATFTCPGTGSQDVVELSCRAFYVGTQTYVRLSIYTSDGSTKICEGVGKTALPSSIGWVGHGSLMSNALTPTTPTLTGGDTYLVRASFDGSGNQANICTSSGSGDGYSSSDYYDGYPSTAPSLSDLPGLMCIRVGVQPSSACTPATITRHTTIKDTVGNVAKRYGHATTGTIDSVKFASTTLDSVAMLSYTTKDTIVYRAKKKAAKTALTVTAYSCAGVNTSVAYDTLEFVGWSGTYTARVDTANILATKTVSSMSLADSVTFSGLPTGASGNKTHGTISWTPAGTTGATSVKIIGWHGGIKSDSTTLSMSSVIGVIKIDSITPDTVLAGANVTVKGRHFGVHYDSLSGTIGGLAITFLGCTNDTILMTVPAALDTGLYDLILTDAYSADTLIGGIYVEPPAVTQFTLTMVNSTPAGTISPTAGAHSLDSNTTQAISHTCAAGYRFHKWTRTASTPASPFGDSTLASTTITVRGNVTVTAVDTIIHYTRTMVNSSPAGTLSPAAGATSVDSGAVFNLTYTPPTGYGFWKYTRSGLTVHFADSSLASTTAWLSGNGTITANDTTLKYYLTMVAGTGTSVTPASGYVSYGAATAIVATVLTTPKGYSWHQWVPSGAASIGNTNLQTTTATIIAAGGAQATAYCTPATIAYTQTTVTCTVGVAMIPIVPVITGEYTAVTVSPALPAGISVHSTTGAISGTPTTRSGATSRTFSFLGNCNPGTDAITFSVIDTSTVITTSTTRNPLYSIFKFGKSWMIFNKRGR